MAEGFTVRSTGYCRKFYNWLNPVKKPEQAYAANE
jgi:hypothetical protein